MDGRDWSNDSFDVPSWDWKKKAYVRTLLHQDQNFGAGWPDAQPVYSAPSSVTFEILQKLSNIEFQQKGVYSSSDAQTMSGPQGYLEVEGILIGARFEFFTTSPASDWLAGDPVQARYGSASFCDEERCYEPKQFVDFPKQLIRPQQLFPAKGVSWYFREGNAGTITLLYIASDSDQAVRVGHKYVLETAYNFYEHYTSGELTDFPELDWNVNVYPSPP